MPRDDYDVAMFDLGGVLIELGGVTKLLEWTASRLTAAQLWHKWLASPAGRLFEAGAMAPNDFARAMAREFELPVTPEVYLREFIGWVVKPYPGSHDLLRRLSGFYTLACLSNTNGLHWPRMRDEMGLGQFFRHIFVSHETGLVKPDQEAFEHALNALSCPSERVLYFDDSEPNVSAAAALGMAAYRVNGIEDITARLRNLGI
ncbi:MAG: HAD-IA family hydrolase [Verrucomicrobiota bacterium]|nr:HAD-IA family hydrolase [Verrucomicrobiota bacterium]